MGDENSATLVVEDVHKRFQSTKALNGLSFSVGHAERLALLGPNGAGKTTLVRAICGRVKLDRGNITIADQSARSAGASRHLGVVPQDLALYPDLTAEENLKAFARLHGIHGSKIKHRVNWALQWIGLESRRTELVRGFSGGMKRRVNIACGILHEPTVLILDEPTVGVDPQSRHRIFDMLDELHANGTSIVLTTHHLDEAQSRCDRIVIVDYGKTIAEGTIEELIDSTVGRQRHIFMHTDQPVSVPKSKLQWDSEQKCLAGKIGDSRDELQNVLNAVQESGVAVLDMEMHRPDLSDVFLHLTGRQLRE